MIRWSTNRAALRRPQNYFMKTAFQPVFIVTSADVVTEDIDGRVTHTSSTLVHTLSSSTGRITTSSSTLKHTVS